MPAPDIHVLYLSYDGMTDPLGQSQVIPYLEGLSKKNVRFTLVSFEKEAAYKLAGDAIGNQLKNSGIRWIPLSYTKKPQVLSTVYDLWKLRKKVHALIQKEKIDIVHCRSYITALVGLWVKKNWNIKFVFDMRGLWADERVDGKLWNLNNPLYKSVYDFFKNKETEFLLYADQTVSLTHAAKAEILSWEKLSGNKIPIEVIPCCVDLALFDPAKVSDEQLNTWRKKLGINPGTFVLTYLGSIGTWYMLDEMLLFFKKLREKIPGARFLFITRDEHARILQQAGILGLENDIILQPAARADVPALISLSRYSIFFILPSYSKKASSPTKQGELMAMGIPVICNNGVGDTDNIIQKYESGYIADLQKLDDTVEAVSHHDKEFSKEIIMRGAKDYFSLDSGIEKYLSIYQKLV